MLTTRRIPYYDATYLQLELLPPHKCLFDTLLYVPAVWLNIITAIIADTAENHLRIIEKETIWYSVILIS